MFIMKNLTNYFLKFPPIKINGTWLIKYHYHRIYKTTEIKKTLLENRVKKVV